MQGRSGSRRRRGRTGGVGSGGSGRGRTGGGMSGRSGSRRRRGRTGGVGQGGSGGVSSRTGGSPGRSRHTRGGQGRANRGQNTKAESAVASVGGGLRGIPNALRNKLKINKIGNTVSPAKQKRLDRRKLAVMEKAGLHPTRKGELKIDVSAPRVARHIANSDFVNAIGLSDLANSIAGRIPSNWSVNVSLPAGSKSRIGEPNYRSTSVNHPGRGNSALLKAIATTNQRRNQPMTQSPRVMPNNNMLKILGQIIANHQ